MIQLAGFFGARAMPDPDPTAMALYAEASHGSNGFKGSKGFKSSWSKGMGKSGKSDAFADAVFMPEETQVVNQFKVCLALQL